MKNIFTPQKTLWLAAVAFSAGHATPTNANPTGLGVVSGSASTHASGSQLNITTSQLAILNWQTFNIQNGETTTFLQPSANSVVFNIIGDVNPSQIYGNLNANGTVILANANGFYFGPNSMIRVGGSFIATTAPIPTDPGIDAGWQFNGAPPLASIVNYGQISVGTGKSLYLIANNIANYGALAAPGGNVELAAGDNVLVSESADGRGLSASVQLPKGSVDNFGHITADAGTIAMQAQVVNQNGVIQADSVSEQNGVVELVASDSLNLGANSQILARGDDSVGGSAGGQVTLKSGNTFTDATGSQIATTGGANGGNGGNVEVSAPNVESLNTAMDAGAAAGSSAGNFLLDPSSITLGTTGTGTVPANGTVASGSSPSSLTLNVTTAFANKNFSDIILQSTGNITLSANTSWNLSSSTGENSGQLLLEAGGDIIFNTGAKIMDANGWSVSLFAGYNFTSQAITSGVGNIYLNTLSGGTGSGSITIAAGSINLQAGASIQQGTGALSATTGNINLLADGSLLLGKGTLGTTAGNIDLTALGSLQTGAGAISSASGNIDMDSGGNLTFGTGAVSTTGGGMELDAGGNIQVGTAFVTSGGNMDLEASGSILVGTGSVYTTGGGNLFAYAATGDINGGTFNGSNSGPTKQTSDYRYTGISSGVVNPFLTGMSTEAGGNVTLIAGGNVTCQPTTPSGQLPGAAGAYGAGDVTVVAGGQITGSFNVANGNGNLLAGVQATSAQAAALQQAAQPSSSAALTALEQKVQSTQNSLGNIGGTPQVTQTSSGTTTTPSATPVTLSLIDGTWNAYAANDISLKEVNNPNGAFDTFPGSTYANLYNYAPNAAVNLWAGNEIELIGANLGRTQNTTPIYAPSLSLNAGAGGILFDTGIILAPSSQGSLSIVTRNGGDLDGVAIQGSTVLNGITMSDSLSTAYGTFLTEHDNIHQHDPNPQPVYLDISGSINSFKLVVPTFADINVAQNTYNFGFQGRNLSPSQTTTINVDGAITYHGDLTTEILTAAQLADPLPTALFTDSADPSVTQNLRYDASTGTLIFVGAMSAAEEAFLLSPSIIKLDGSGNPITQPVLDSDGNPVLDANGNPEFAPVTVPLALDATQQALIIQLHNDSQSASLGDQGLALTGPGTFNVNADTMDLGVSGGIRVLAPDSAAESISLYGANLNVTTLGDLSMTSTKISNESLGGNVDVTVGGALNVGDQFSTLGDPTLPKGIYTTGGGNVTVTAQGDVDINGSRIATYDGGNIAVESQTGDVNAGTGGAGYVAFTALQLDPLTDSLINIPATIPGSGIVATTVPGADALLGDITIKAPEGSLNANLGGVLQISLDGTDTSHTFINVDVGNDINATGSGIIGANINLKAGGNINGVVVGSQSVDISSLHNVDVTVVSSGNVDVSASGSVSGTIVGGADVSVSGSTVDAAVIGASVAASGDTAGAALGVPASNVAKVNTEVADNADAATTKTDSGDSNDQTNKPITLAQKVSRVTVILPVKNN